MTAPDVQAFLAASTEPRPRGRGELMGAAGTRIRAEASTEPRPRGRGECPCPANNAVMQGRASTEPRPRGRGEHPRPQAPRPRVVGFNGATTSRPWRESTMSRRLLLGLLCFNGATTSRPWRAISTATLLSNRLLLQRSHDLAAVERQGALSSEEVEERLQRSHDLAAVERTPRGEEPTNAPRLQRSHDLAAVESASGQGQQGNEENGFNGATTSRPWRAAILSVRGTVWAQLQRSHDLAAVESGVHSGRQRLG